MDIDAKRKLIAILKVLHQYGQPMGSVSISRRLEHWGIELRERMVRYYLELADQAGFTRNLGRRGRILTERGRRELDIGIAIDKVGFVAARIDEMAYNMTFNLDEASGTVILNTTLLPRAPLRRILTEMKSIIDAELGVGKYIRFHQPGTLVHGLLVPQDHVALSTVCSVTLNGVLLQQGIIMTSRFGGLLELVDGQPARFSHIISYDGSTLDPLVTFIKGRMTSVRRAAATGTGTIGASFREIPIATLPAARTIIARLSALGLGGVLMIGKPNQPLLDIPVGYGRVGIIVAGGLNPIAVAEELDSPGHYYAMHDLCEFSRLTTIDDFLQNPDEFF